MPNTQKLFLYARKSTDDTGRQIQSIPDQISELRAFAHSNNISVVDVLVEKRSAKQPGRKVFEAMLNRIADGEAGGILSWHPDRLARNMTDGARLVELIESLGMNLVFPTYRFEKTPQDIFCLTLAFGQSKLYVDNLSENTKRGMRNKAKRGIYPSVAPVGYLNNRNTREIDPDPEYAPFVVSLFKKYSTSKYTYADLRFSTRSGKKISVSSVQRTLSNPFYYGIFTWGRETYEGSHTPLITKKLFDQCQTVMEQRGREYKKHEPKRYPYRQLLTCGHCGCSITSSIAKGTYIYYHCSRRKGKCDAKFLNEKMIDEEVRSALQKISLTPADAQSVEAELRKLHNKEVRAGVSRTDTLRSAISRINEKLDTLLDMSLSDEITRDEYIIKKKKLLAEKADLHEKSRRMSNGSDDRLELTLSVIYQAVAIQNALEGTDPAILADFFKTVCSNRKLCTDRIVFRPHNGWKALYDVPRQRVPKSHTRPTGSVCRLLPSGSAGGIRTCDLPVNSRLLYR